MEIEFVHARYHQPLNNKNPYLILSTHLTHHHL